MSAVLDAIEQKKRGEALPADTIRAVVDGFTRGDVPDYQMSALLMAIVLRGMELDEIRVLTQAMADSGPRYAFPDCVDKHSTGGVGDKVTLCALPIVAACGVPVAKLSGRGLGTTGGTIDKLEAIPGFRVALAEDAFRAQVDAVGLAIAEAGELAPADKAIYALRDATGTVDSMALIGSSIVSKKVATGAGHLLYDVKAGSGAFMKTLDAARELADLLVGLTEGLGIRASALITDMDVALGSAVGNALEVNESVAFLRGEPVSADLADVCRDVATELLALAGVGDPGARVDEALASGRAWETFLAVVEAQGGDASAVAAGLPVSPHVREVLAPAAGHVVAFDALGIARGAVELGAGRQTKADALDFGAGVELLATVGDVVAAGAPVARLYGERSVDRAAALVADALVVADAPVACRPHVLDRR